MFSNIFKTSTLVLLVSAILFVSSCSKDDSKPELAEIYITITSPTINEAFDQNATVNITGKIEYAGGLHGYQIIIRKTSDNSIQFEKDAHAHGVAIDFNESWVNNLAGHNDMELEVVAIIDHDGNTVSKKVNFHCHD